MRVMPAGQFKSKCLKVMEHVADTGEPVVVTKHGRRVVEVIPVREGAPGVFGRLAGSIAHEGDLVAPVTVTPDAMGE